MQAASVLATLLTAATLSTLVQGVVWFVEVLVVVVAVALVGMAVRRYVVQPAVAVAAQLLAVVLLLTWLYAQPEALFGLLPSAGSTTRLLDLAAAGLEVTQTAAPPAPSLPGVRLLVTAGVALVAVAVDLVAVGLRQPAVAGLPLLAVYCVPAALARGGLDWYWFVLAGAGFLLLVASDAGDRVARWGRVLHGQGGESAPMAATGRRVGALALVAALVVPTLVPGLAEGLFFGRGQGTGPGPGGTISVINPIFSLRDNLSAPRNLPVLSYETDATQLEPLRIVTVDTFDGETWKPTTGQIPRSQEANGELPPPPGLGPDVATQERRYRITIDTLAQTWLPAPYPPVRVDILGPWLYEAGTLNIVGNGVETEPGLSYDVRYLEVTPTPQQLLAAPPPTREVAETWTTLPEDVPEVVLATAREQAGEGTPYEQAVRLQAYFRSGGGFAYSTEAPDGNGSSALGDFLERRSGYCIHFASAMAVMARSLGIPARVAVGFLPGQQDAEQPESTFQVNVQDAHAWPELYFSGVGWVRFEPTPQTRTGALPSWASPPPDLQGTQLPQDLPPSGQQEVAPDSPSTSADVVDPSDDGLSVSDVVAAVPWRLVAALALVLAVASAPLVASSVVRRRRWRRAEAADDPGSARAETAWTTLAEQVRDLGHAFPASATPRQAEDRLGEEVDDDARASLHRVARAVERARYARSAGVDEGLAHDVSAVVRSLRARRPARATWRARWLPPSGVEHLRNGLTDAGLALDRAERRLAVRVRAALPRTLPGGPGRT